MKRPAFQFYPGDWQRDAALRACSVGARGLWIEMMCVMHQAKPYGYLVLNGNSIESAQLARMVGASQKETVRWLSELKAAGTYSVDSNGQMYSRRMVRDEDLRNRRADGGRLGGNPALVGGKVNHDLNLEPTPSSSLSSSSSPSGTNPSAASGKISLSAAGSWEGVSDDKRQVWTKAYPAVDLDVELAAMAAWALENPANRKSNWGRFITSWLKRAQDRAPAKGGGLKVVKNWQDTWSGIVEKGKSLGIEKSDDESNPEFKQRVMTAAKVAA